MKSSEVKYIQMDVNYYGNIFPKVRFYPNTNEKLKSSSLKNEDGYWFGLYINNCIPINARIVINILFAILSS